ncbi:protein kinase domain-containing protein [Colletotrichum karsti]|uniref:Protein kinase domain-containing protein n=1 Tax=Colletotrichum karsti TaxID=1095194 RepID=A0A9P6LFD6_9PEZI|nr:protein kinase domain-containing protein [Colletotrichum karsti]KAF9870212.1 protein kinase domain-containing protein [Colletotrichum karsti]
MANSSQSSGPSTTQADLRLDELLRSHFQEHPLPEVTDGYLPAGFLDELVCHRTVRKELAIEFAEELDSDELDRLTEKLGSLKRFLDPKTGVRDEDLPLQKVDLDERNIDLRKRSDPEVRLNCFAGWRHNSLKSFDDWQWTMNVPILTRATGSKAQHRKFADRIILPLISMSSPYGGGNGGYSETFKIQLHPRHHDFNSADPNCFFALKRVRSTDTKAFQRELENLRKFENDKSHEHLISLLTTWSHKGYFHFLFPWAECDLSKYWELDSQPVMTVGLVQWVARQTTGMADGLALIHEYPDQVDGTPENAARYGRHGDIKPANILWFKDLSDNRGTLVISDFGLGDFYYGAIRSGIPSSDIARTPSYRPPECDVEGASISRSCDIWTLGCVYVEFATWLLGGWELVEQFTDYRLTGSSIWGQTYMSDLFFDIVDLHATGNEGMGAMVKPEVTRWFDGLHNHRKCTNYIHDLLILVQNEMLIVESISRKRATCKAWHAQSNMHIALDAKRDGKRIQNISMFSMVFLPSMFVATIFSTDSFNWFPPEGQAIISPYFWVLIVFSACLTLFILGGYYMLSSRVLSLARLKLKCPSSFSPV